MSRCILISRQIFRKHRVNTISLAVFIVFLVAEAVDFLG